MNDRRQPDVTGVTAGTIFDKTRTPLTSWFAAIWYVTNQKDGVEVREPKGFGRVRLRRIPDVSAGSLVPFVCEAVEPGSKVQTDGRGGYEGLSKRGYRHEITIHSSSGDPAHVSMPAVHRVSSLLKRSLLGTHQGCGAKWIPPLG